MTHPIKTRRDGSIDTSHYIAKGRQARSDAARQLVCGSPVPPRRASRHGRGTAVLTLIALVAILPAWQVVF